MNKVNHEIVKNANSALRDLAGLVATDARDGIYESYVAILNQALHVLQQSLRFQDELAGHLYHAEQDNKNSHTRIIQIWES